MAHDAPRASGGFWLDTTWDSGLLVVDSPFDTGPESAGITAFSAWFMAAAWTSTAAACTAEGEEGRGSVVVV